MKCKLEALPVGASPTLSVSTNDARRYLAIRNIGSNRMWFDFDRDPVSNRSWPLDPGEGFEWQGQNVPSNELRAVSSLGTTLVVMVA